MFRRKNIVAKVTIILSYIGIRTLVLGESENTKSFEDNESEGRKAGNIVG